MSEQQTEKAPIWLCETATAGPWTPNHLRRLSDRGPLLGGGADTPAFCGRQVAWDVRAANLADLTPNYTCPRCVEVAGLLAASGDALFPPATTTSSDASGIQSFRPERGAE